MYLTQWGKENGKGLRIEKIFHIKYQSFNIVLVTNKNEESAIKLSQDWSTPLYNVQLQSFYVYFEQTFWEALGY